MLSVASYIHGGAWRDPAVDSSSFVPAVQALWKSSMRSSIAGFAAINYRLSPYPSHPDDPSSPDDPARNVHHPAHVDDVVQALIYLEEKYSISRRYLLVGHSAGATLAFQVHKSYVSELSIPLPLGILGVAGIYHFQEFVEAHRRIPAYREIMENAFPDKNSWEEACPYTNELPDAAWEHAKAIVISHSDQDELVDRAQSSLMLERLSKAPELKSRVHFLEASGSHDEIWASGYILAHLVIKTLQILKPTPSVGVGA